MVKTFVRLIITLGVGGGVLYGLLGSVWSVAILFTLLGIFYEAGSIRDMLEEKFAYAQHSLDRLNIFNHNENKKNDT